MLRLNLKANQSTN